MSWKNASILVLTVIGTASVTAYERSGVSPYAVDVRIIKPAALGDPRNDLLYNTARAPCRLIDTRVGGGSLAPGELRYFSTSPDDAAAIEAQGGSPGCTVPEDTAAIMVNLVAVAPEGMGNLKAAATEGVIPEHGSVINYAAVPGLNIANAVTVPLCGPEVNTLCSGADFKIQVNGARTHLVADVLGYFRKHESSFVHTATSANTLLHITAIDHPLTNGNPRSLLQVTQHWKPGSAPGIYNPHPIGVYYNDGQWRIFNQDLAEIPDGASFNVLVVNRN